jgi:hypothetical protein
MNQQHTAAEVPASHPGSHAPQPRPFRTPGTFRLSTNNPGIWPPIPLSCPRPLLRSLKTKDLQRKTHKFYGPIIVQNRPLPSKTRRKWAWNVENMVFYAPDFPSIIPQEALFNAKNAPPPTPAEDPVAALSLLRVGRGREIKHVLDGPPRSRPR